MCSGCIHTPHLLWVVTQDIYHRQLLPDGLRYHHGSLQKVISDGSVRKQKIRNSISEADVATLLHGSSFLLHEKCPFHQLPPLKVHLPVSSLSCRLTQSEMCFPNTSAFLLCSAGPEWPASTAMQKWSRVISGLKGCSLWSIRLSSSVTAISLL